MRPYGVDVVNFIPGSFVMSSNITARQEEYAKEQLQEFSSEQLGFYGEYFHRYANFLKFLSGRKSPNIMKDEGVLMLFESALLENGPKSVYKYEPMRYYVVFSKTIIFKYNFFRYTIYHFLFRISPIFVRDWLILKFIGLPRYNKEKSKSY